MASVNQTVIECIQRDPAVCQSRTDALYSIFAFSGDGWEWVDGEMVDTDADPRKRTTPYTADSEEAALRSFWASIEPDIIDNLLAGQRARREAWEVIASEAEERATRTGFGEAILADIAVQRMIIDENNYDSWTNAKFVNVPADAKPEWAAAAQEVRTLLEAEGFNFS